MGLLRDIALCGLMGCHASVGAGPSAVASATTDESASEAGPTEAVHTSTTGTSSTSAAAESGFSSGSTTGAVTCRIEEEDCPPGEKCMPWANDGGDDWNDTRCVPIAPDAADLGEPCFVDGSRGDGADTCGLHSLCWYVDPKTSMGTCVGLCTDPGQACADADACWITHLLLYEVIGVCRPRCDPLEPPDCPPNAGCYAHGAIFSCQPSGDAGAILDPCDDSDDCDPGLACLVAEAVPGCTRPALGCCSPFCDVDDADPPCLLGQSCLPASGDERPQPGLEHVGYCAVPESEG